MSTLSEWAAAELNRTPYTGVPTVKKWSPPETTSTTPAPATTSTTPADTPAATPSSGTDMAQLFGIQQQMFGAGVTGDSTADAAVQAGLSEQPGVRARVVPEQEPGFFDRIGVDSLLAAAEQEQADRRQFRRRVAQPAQGVRQGTELTAEQYEAMSPRQQLAVDFNTQLADAAAADRKIRNGGASANDLYNESVDNIFGEDTRGNQKYAPNTVALLSQLGYENDDATLNDFLKLRMTVSDKELDKFLGSDKAVAAAMSPARAPSGDVVADRGNYVTGLTASLADTQEQLHKAGQYLDNYMNSAIAARASTVTGFGGTSLQASNPALGFGSGENDTAFKTMLLQFSSKGGFQGDQLNRWYEQLDASGIDRRLFTDYALQTIENAENSGTSLDLNITGTEGTSAVDPKELRKRLGFDKAGA